MVPTAEMTVVLVPLAVVVTETTPGRVAVVVRRVGCARVTGTAESHLLFLFCASARSSNSKLIQFALTVNLLSVALTYSALQKYS